MGLLILTANLFLIWIYDSDSFAKQIVSNSSRLLC